MSFSKPTTGMQLLTVMLINALLITPVFAAVVTWDGSQNNNWRNNTNWTNGGTPGPDDTAIFPIGLNKNEADLRGTGGNNKDWELDTIDLRTDGNQFATAPATPVNWFFKLGRILPSDIIWKSTATNSQILVNATFHTTNFAVFSGDDSGASSLHLYGGGLSGVSSTNTFWLASNGGDDSLVIHSNSTAFAGEFKVTSGKLIPKRLNALENARIWLLGGELILDNSVILGHLTGGGTSPPVNIQADNLLKFGLYGGNQTFAGVFTGTGHLFYNNNSADSWTLAGVSPFSGRTTINGNLIFTSGGSLANSPINLNIGSLTVNTATTIGNLHGGGNLNLNAALIIGDALIDPDEAFDGPFSGTGSLTIAAGDHEFTDTPGLGSSTYFGNVNLNGGSTIFGAGLFAENLVTINTNLVMDMNASTTLGGFAGTGTTDLNFNLTFGGLDQNNTYSGDLTGNGVLNKNGTGTWAFNAAKTGTGQVNINAGTLGGSGSFAAKVYIGASAEINPGASTSTITAASIEIDGVYICELDGSSNDGLIIAGNLDIWETTLNLSQIGAGATAPVYIIASYGSLTGTFAAVQNLPTFYTLDYAYDDGSSTNNIALVGDLIPPTLDSIALDAAFNDPTNVSSVDFNISFSEPVNGLDATDFNISFPGSTGTASLTGSGAAYSLSIPNIAGDGTLAVTLVPAHGITDLFGNPLAATTASATVVIDQTRPMVDSFTAITGSPSNATEIKFSVIFSEDIFDFNDAADVSTTLSGTAAYTGVVITGSGTTYTIKYTGVSGIGGLSATVKSAVGGARDAAGNILFLNVIGPTIALEYCNNSLAAGSVNGAEEFEACEHLFTETNFHAEEFATVIFAAGQGVTINPNFTLDVGAILQVKVCGQSLCEVSSQPMEDGCHSCVTDICAIDITCCTDAYSQACLDKVATVCNLSCQ
ncbi:MAG: hypothetical protein L3J24_06025 [Xanthomonadales bacterium]|nr:hypothetical protein [Xanthomonadales bacterium]